MKNHVLFAAAAPLILASAALAEGRDRNQEKVRQLNILTDTCEKYSGDKFENCVDNLVGHSALVMCMTLYKKDDATRLECFDESALNAGIKLMELNAD